MSSALAQATRPNLFYRFLCKRQFRSPAVPYIVYLFMIASPRTVSIFTTPELGTKQRTFRFFSRWKPIRGFFAFVSVPTNPNGRMRHVGIGAQRK